jgi:beta-lactamase superfamily II metal-dependent hydrolase
MAFNGIEIDMMSLGDADSILVTDWNNDVPTYILIDGGYAKDAAAIEKFLAARGVEDVTHLVSTHLHDDHIRGLVRLVQNNKFGIRRAWVHQPELHVDTDAMNDALEKTAALKESRLITASVQAEQNLVQALKEREIVIAEPFQGTRIGALTVCGPSQAYYEGLLSRYRDAKKIRQLQEQLDRQKTAADIGKYLGRTAAKLLDDPKTEAENLSCTVLATKLGKDLLLLTADAGAESLRHAADYADLSNCRWMQIPHHGSLYNITQPLVDLLRPKSAYVSAAGNDEHPHPAVVAAFKEAGATVYSTQKPNAHLWFSVGSVPKRDDYVNAVPL